MDKDTEEAVASPSEGASGDPNIMNVAEGVIAEDGNYYIVTEGTEGDNEEVLLVVMNGDGETLETVSCVDGSGIEFLDQEQNLIGTVEQTSVSSADEGVLYQIGYTGQSTSSQVSVGNVTSDGSKVEGQYVVAGAPQLKSIEHGASVGSQIVGGNLQTVVEGGPKLKTILPPNLVERLANKGTQGSPVSKKETQSMSENLNTKMSKQTTLGYTTISKSIGSQTPIAKVTKNVVTIDSLKSLGNVLKSGSVSKMPQTDSRNNQIVTLQLGKAQDGRVGHSLLEKSIAMDREEMSKTADVLVELATGNSAGLMGKDKTLMGITEGVSSNVSASQESNFVSGIISIPALQRGDSKQDKVYKDVTQEEELEIILHEIENMCNKLADYDEEFIVISINKTLRSSCFSSKVGKEFLDNNPDIVERFLQYSFGKKESMDKDETKKSSPVRKSAKPVLSKTPVRKSTRKRAANPKFDSEEYITDSVKSKRNRNFYDSDADDDDEEDKKNLGEKTQGGSKEVKNLTEMNLDGQKQQHQFPCGVCKKRFRRKDILDVHMKVHVKVKEPEKTENYDLVESSDLDLNIKGQEQKHHFPCDVCNKRFSSKDVLDVHLKVHASVGDVESGHTTSDIDVMKNDGPVTGDLIDDAQVEGSAVPISEDGSQNILKGGRVLRKRKRAKIGILDADDEGDILSATTFNTKLRRSWKNIKNEEIVKFKCSVCGMCFRGLYQLKKHYDDHATCPHCDKPYLNQEKLEMHIAQLHKESVKAKVKDIQSKKNTHCAEDDGSEVAIDQSHAEDSLAKKNDNGFHPQLQQEIRKDNVDCFDDRIDENESSMKQNDDETQKQQEKDEFAQQQEGNGSAMQLEGDKLARLEGEDGSPSQQGLGDEKSQTVINTSEDGERNVLEEREGVQDEARGHGEDGIEDQDENEITVHLEDIKRQRFPCRKCNMEFTTSQNLRRHYKRHINNYEFQCRICSKQFNRSDLFKSHMIINHGFSGREKTQPHYPFICSYCGNRYTSKSVLNTHIRSKHTDNQTVFQCEICSKLFKQKAHLSRHMLLHSTDRKLFECEACGRKFKQKQSLECHKCEVDGVLQKTQREEGEFVCNTCGKSFVDVRRLNIHYRVHLDGRKTLDDLFCSVCKREFTSVSNLMKHLRFVHSDVRNFVCDTCQKSFKTKDALIRHSEVHKEIDGSYSCEICNKFLKTKESLKVHLASHSEIKPFICEICGASFHQKANLHKHLLIHSDTFNHACDICGRKFRAVETYKAHMRAHAIRDGKEVDVKKFGKYYECEYCQKRIATSSRYKIHLRIHTNEKPFICEFCEQSFHEPQKYKRHMKKHEIPSEKSAEETLQEIYVQHVPDEGEITQVINLQDLPFLQNSGVQEVTVQTDETTEAPTLTIYIDQDGVLNNIA